MTTKLNAATAKLDALTTKTHDIWQTTHFTKGYLQNGIPTTLRHDRADVLGRFAGPLPRLHRGLWESGRPSDTNSLPVS